MEAVIAGIIAGLVALIALAFIALGIAYAVLGLRILNAVIADIKENR